MPPPARIPQVKSKAFYTGFEEYLKKAHCVENLYCLRMHRRFLKFLHAAAANPTAASEAVLEAVEEAWDLYKFFVAVGTCVRPFHVCFKDAVRVSAPASSTLHSPISHFSYSLVVTVQARATKSRSVIWTASASCSRWPRRR